MVCLTSLNGPTAITSIILVVLQADRCLVEGAVEHKLYLSSHLQDRWRVHESFQIMAVSYSTSNHAGCPGACPRTEAAFLCIVYMALGAVHEKAVDCVMLLAKYRHMQIVAKL